MNAVIVSKVLAAAGVILTLAGEASAQSRGAGRGGQMQQAGQSGATGQSASEAAGNCKQV